jgi:biopolymer transport protein ExbD
VLADGRTVVAGKVLDEAALEAAFTAARSRSPDTVVMFQADEGVAHGRVVQVMELARRAGLARLAIATRAEPSNARQ